MLACCFLLPPLRVGRSARFDSGWHLPRRTGRIAILAVLLVTLAAPRFVVAQAKPAPRAQLRLHAEKTCATRDAIVASVQTRAPRVVLTDEASVSPVLEVTLRTDAHGEIAAELVVRASGRRALRRLTATSCSAAVDALALLIAWTLDPGGQAERGEARDLAHAQANDAEASRAGEPGRVDVVSESRSDRPDKRARSPRSREQVAPSEHTHPDASSPRPEDEPPAETSPTPSLPNEAPPRATATPSAAHENTRAASRAEPARDALAAVDAPRTPPLELTARVSVAGVGSLGFAPHALFGVGGAGQLELARGDWLSLAVRIAYAHHAWRSLRAEGGRAAFALDHGTLDVCPGRLRASSLTLRACLAAALGRLRASGHDTYLPAATHLRVGNLGGALLAALSLVGPLDLELRAALGAPLARQRFSFAPQVFHRTAPVILSLELGVSVHFP
jgi:hypothetical protein